jgi:hypothetical protein
MATVDMGSLFRGGFSRQVEIKQDQIVSYQNALDNLTTRLIKEYSDSKHSEIDADRMVLSTTVEHQGKHRLVAENCGNLQKIIESCVQNKKPAIDDRTLAKLDAILKAAVEQKLEVVYKEAEVSEGGKQELTILTNYGPGQPPETRGVRAIFGADTEVTAREFSADYNDQIAGLAHFMPGGIQQEQQENKETDHPSDFESKLKSNPKGSLAEEELRDLTRENATRAEGRRQDDISEKHRLEQERSFDVEDQARDRERDRKKESA